MHGLSLERLPVAYSAVFEWVYDTKWITGEFVRTLFGLRVVTNPGT
jgi:hypothetical protein